MGWIVGLRDTFEGIKLVERDEASGTVSIVFPEEASLSIASDTSKQKWTGPQTASFSEFEPCTDAATLDRLRIPQDAQRTQTFFQLTLGGKRYYIPSQVLISGLFGVDKRASRWMLTPAGIQVAGSVTIDKQGAGRLTAAKGQRIFDYRHAFIKALLTWTTYYPCARRAEASIFFNALRGRFDLKLPSGTMLATFRFVDIENESLITSIRVSSVFPSESSTGQGLGKEIVFRLPVDGAHRKLQAARQSKGDTDLVAFKTRPKLSESEWAACKPIIESKNRIRSPRIKYRLEQIIEKFARKTAWRQLGSDAADALATRVFFVSLQKDGRWERIKEALVQCRRPTLDAS
ncbi:hypothetical protein [Aquabacterium sp.]|uniref:hypothetical protein n=1 Tax=Aquabacterium sp. TaxID=1872578 RepID=UPI00248775BF|nr:hypothetical protein [Aquabacterium sp.]MDI1258302.1 hypothetical protein [Aquabacterium sp.]